MDISNDIVVKHTKLPKYLGDLFDIEQEVILVCGKKKGDSYETCNFNNLNTSKCNLTGTPLEVDLDGDVSIVVRHSRGQREDKELVPVKLCQARMFINNHNLNTKVESKYDTIVCICDGTDKQCTLVLMSSLSNRWFNRTTVCALDCVSLSYISNNFDTMQKYHISNCEPGSIKVQPQLSCLYEFYGYHLNDYDLEDDVSTIGSVFLDCSWNTLQFDVAEHKSQINLMLQVVVGHKISSMFHLYQDLEFLQKCLTELSNINNIETAKLAVNPKEDYEIFDSITDILNTVHTIKFQVCESNIFEARHDFNFTDKLWNTLKYCENTITLKQCFSILFDKIESGHLKIQILEDDKNTIIGETVHCIFSNRMLIPHLSYKQCLELLVDLGVQKLKKSYLHIIKSCDSNIATEYQEKWNKIFPTAKEKKFCIIELPISEEFSKAQFLFRTHILMEFLQLTESCQMENVKKKVLKPAFDKYLMEPIPNTFFNIKTKRLCDLKVPLTFDDISILLSSNKPSMWKMKLATSSNRSSVTTVFYYSKKPIFPATIYNYGDDLNETAKEEKFYAVRLETYSNKGHY
ncbi:hypothetical protein RN001_006153 [Aquatica leii]|uniref:Protein zwilch n=1 Tax=Aquatica leii TaxID=1421715 RepID=A0AAN7PDA2_9COLE|nr:hypothetical protein RN001_006153 [Aquatica leii]